MGVPLVTRSSRFTFSSLLTSNAHLSTQARLWSRCSCLFQARPINRCGWRPRALRLANLESQDLPCGQEGDSGTCGDWQLCWDDTEWRRELSKGSKGAGQTETKDVYPTSIALEKENTCSWLLLRSPSMSVLVLGQLYLKSSRWTLLV